MRTLVTKWIVKERHYEGGEVVSTNFATYGWGKNEKDIHFDTEAEAEEYIDGRPYCGAEAFELVVSEESGINYKILKVKWAEEEAARKLYLKPCPFCGKSPERIDSVAKCNNCNISLSAEVWNERKYRW